MYELTVNEVGELHIKFPCQHGGEIRRQRGQWRMEWRPAEGYVLIELLSPLGVGDARELRIYPDGSWRAS